MGALFFTPKPWYYIEEAKPQLNVSNNPVARIIATGFVLTREEAACNSYTRIGQPDVFLYVFHLPQS